MTDSNQSNTKPTDGHCPKCGADICAQLAEAYDAGRESMEEDEERTGTMACPICGLDSPHQHLTQDVEAWRAKEMAGESSEVIPLCFAKHPTEPLLRCALDCEHAGRDPNDHQWFQFSPESIARREALSGAAQPRGDGACFHDWVMVDGLRDSVCAKCGFGRPEAERAERGEGERWDDRANGDPAPVCSVHNYPMHATWTCMECSQPAPPASGDTYTVGGADDSFAPYCKHGYSMKRSHPCGCQPERAERREPANVQDVLRTICAPKCAWCGGAGCFACSPDGRSG